MKRTASPAYLLFLLLAGIPAGAATVTVDTRTEHQTIEGFGGFGVKRPYTTEYYDDEWLSMLISDLGLSMHRMGLDYHFEETNDNADPNVIDWSGFTIEGTQNALVMDYMRAMHAAALEAGEVYRPTITAWTPVPWMKQDAVDCIDGPGACGGTLRPDMYEEYAEWYEAYATLFRERVGIYPYGMSIANEPNFHMWYISSTFTTPDYVDAFKVMAHRFANRGIPMKWFGPEDIIEGEWGVNTVAALCADPVARDALHAVAIHGYGADGVAPYSNSSLRWLQHGTQAGDCGKALWMTETEGYIQTLEWDAAFALAKGLYSGMYYGNMAAFTWWQLEDQFFYDDFSPTPVYHAAKHFYRYIRPGAVRVETATDAAGLYAVACTHKVRNQFTINIINDNAGVESVALSTVGANLPANYTVYRSSASERCVEVGTVDAGAAFTVPGQSITTLFGTYGVAGAPTVEIASPTSGTAVVYGQPVTFEMSVAGGTPNAIELYHGGLKIGETSSTSFTWNAPPRPGTYTIRARALAGDGTGNLSQPVELAVAPVVGAGTGLRGEYFSGTAFGTPVLIRTDPTIDFAWGDGSPAAEVGSNNFSVRWTGQIVPLYSEAYTFYTLSDDGIRVTIDGQVVIDHFEPHGPTERTGTIGLLGQRPYEIVVEFYENYSAATAKLEWASNTQRREVVPSTQLYLPGAVVGTGGETAIRRTGARIPTETLVYTLSGRLVRRFRGPSLKHTSAHGRAPSAATGTHVIATLDDAGRCVRRATVRLDNTRW